MASITPAWRQPGRHNDRGRLLTRRRTIDFARVTTDRCRIS